MKDLVKPEKFLTPGTDPQDGGFDTFLNYVATRDPANVESALPYHNYPWLPFWWQNATTTDDWATYTTNSYWLCVDNTSTNMVWWEMVFDANILPVLADQGWQTNTNRSYSAVSSPAFNTAYMPSSTNDTQIIATVGLTSGLGGSAAVTIQMDFGDGYVTIGTESLSGVEATNDRIITAIIPAGASYQLVDSVSGLGSSASIASINQLSL